MEQGVPLCSVCCDVLGKYGGPVSLPCGHNGCLQCMASVAQSSKPEPQCPLCRKPFREAGLTINPELRDLVALATSLHTVEREDGWEAVTAARMPFAPAKGGPTEEAGSMEKGKVALVPTAPPMHMTLSTVLEGDGDLLSLEPPTWLPDSSASACPKCRAPFRALRQMRHHCRLCGGIFCHTCSSKRLLLPPKFQHQEPQRVCDACAVLLQPLQPFLAGTISKAVQAAVHDVTDGSVMRSWCNTPLSASLETDIYKATNIIRAFAQAGSRGPEPSLPPVLLKQAAGFAILSTIKVGLGWSGVGGTGLVVARREGGWSPPCAIALAGLGWGLQAGGTLSDILIILSTKAAVQAFCGVGHIGLGGGASLAVGPFGRNAEAALHLGLGGGALCYTFSISRGAFAGVSIEGTALSSRDEVNMDFYGRPVTAKQLLLGDKMTQPVAAQKLYTALDHLLSCIGAASAARTMHAAPVRGALTHSPPRLSPPSRAMDLSPPGTLQASQVAGAQLLEGDEEEEAFDGMGGLFAD